jgi:hypothetical protein
MFDYLPQSMQPSAADVTSVVPEKIKEELKVFG